MYKDEENLIKYIIKNPTELAYSIVLLILFGSMIQLFLDFYLNSSLKELIQKYSHIETTNLVMDNLDEVIILKNEKGLSYLNKKGFEIIDEI